MGTKHERELSLDERKTIMTDMMAQYSDDDIAALKDETPLNTLGTPEDIAQAAVFLASEKARFITGQVLSVNGGFVI